MVLVPFSIVPPKVLKSFSQHFRGIGNWLSNLFPYLQLEFDRGDMKADAKEYLTMCFFSTLILFIFLLIVLTLFFLKFGEWYFGILLSSLFSFFIFIIQLNYPKVLAFKRIRRLEVDLLAALNAIMIQLNSGVSIFEALVLVSKQEFGEVSKEFAKTVKKINAGVSQVEALEMMALRNPSPYFRRTIWQIVNGVKEGADINKVIESIITNLTKEQIIQIEKYGSQLSPLATFYMMGAVILPALAITFLIILSSFLSFGDFVVKASLIGLLCFLIFFQIMYGGIIKSKRPSLLGE